MYLEGVVQYRHSIAAQGAGVWFCLVGMVLRNQGLGAPCAHYYFIVFATRPFPEAELRNK